MFFISIIVYTIGNLFCCNSTKVASRPEKKYVMQHSFVLDAVNNLDALDVCNFQQHEARVEDACCHLSAQVPALCAGVHQESRSIIVVVVCLDLAADNILVFLLSVAMGLGRVVAWFVVVVWQQHVLVFCNHHRGRSGLSLVK